MARLRIDMGKGARQRWAVVVCSVLLAAAACSGDDGDDGDGGNAGNGTPNAGSGSPTAGNSGRNGGNSGSGAGRGANAGNGSAGRNQGQAGTNSGNAGSSGEGAMDGGSGNDGGGEPDPVGSVCKAPPTPVADPGNDCPAADPVPLQVVTVRSGLDVPVLVTHAPDDDTRLFVVQRNGLILILNPENGETISEFIDLGDAIVTGGGDDERGLLGLAFHPDYPADPRFFVGYTSEDAGKNTLASYEVSAADPNEADPSSEQILIEIDDFAGNHNGGMVAFGRDGCLYFGTGDGGSGDDPQENGQDVNQPLAKILRFDVDNPTQAAPGNMPNAFMHTWDYGLRNPWRFSFDRDTGDLYIGDVGQGAWEEVDVEPEGDGHQNYGWRIAEGKHCRPGQGGCNQGMLDAMTGPVDEYPQGSGDDCVVGGYVYRGAAIDSLKSWYVYGDNGAGRKIRAFVWDGDGRCGDKTIILGQNPRTDSVTLGANITSFGQDNKGELYVTTMNTVYRFAEM